jgi:hypothetical protein
MLDKIKVIIIEKMSKEKNDKERIMFAMLGSLSPDSLESLESHEDFAMLKEGMELKAMWQLIRDIHVVADGSELFRLEEELRTLRMEGKTFYGHLKGFRAVLRAAKQVGSSMGDELVVHILLLSFRGSPIQDAARRCLENSRSASYPKTVAEVQRLLEPAWDLHQLETGELANIEE